MKDEKRCKGNQEIESGVGGLQQAKQVHVISYPDRLERPNRTGKQTLMRYPLEIKDEAREQSRPLPKFE